METKTVEESRTRITKLMRPQQANFAGNVHGGEILSLMDETAYLCASEFAGSYCVTVSVDNVRFEDPIRVGERVELEAAVYDVGDSSMHIGVDVYARDPQEAEEPRQTNRSFFTMIALGEDGDPRPVPDLVCETDRDRELRCEAVLRARLQRKYRRELEEGRCAIAEAEDPEEATSPPLLAED